MSRYPHGKGDPRLRPQVQDLAAAVPAVSRMIRESGLTAKTEGPCGRGCCWTPWAGDICPKARACGCHYAPGRAPEPKRRREPIEQWADVHNIADRFTTSTQGYDQEEAA